MINLETTFKFNFWVYYGQLEKIQADRMSIKRICCVSVFYRQNELYITKQKNNTTLSYYLSLWNSQEMILYMNLFYLKYDTCYILRESIGYHWKYNSNLV